MDSNAIFTWLLASGGLVLGLSWLVGHWPWYNEQSSEFKQILFVALGTVLAAGIHALQLYVPASFWTVADPWIVFISGTVIMLTAAKANHELTKPKKDLDY